MSKWLKYEDEILRSLYGKIKTKDIFTKLSRHSCGSIYKRVRELNLKGNMSLAKRKYSINENFFSNGDLESCYWAGFIAADGCIDDKNNSIKIRLNSKDEQHLERFKKEINFTGPIKKSTLKQKSGNISKISEISLWNTIKLRQDLLEKFNITPRKSLTLKPPDKLTIEQSLAFIIGYIDGDGCIGISNGRLYIRIVGTYSMLAWIRKILSNYCGVNINKKIGSYKKIFYLSYCCNTAICVINSLLDIKCKNRLERKWNKIKEV